jgi:hypothetical protein
LRSGLHALRHSQSQNKSRESAIVLVAKLSFLEARLARQDFGLDGELIRDVPEAVKFCDSQTSRATPKIDLMITLLHMKTGRDKNQYHPIVYVMIRSSSLCIDNCPTLSPLGVILASYPDRGMA